MSATPRTDAAWRNLGPLNDFCGRPVVLADFARELEIELTAARQEASTLRDALAAERVRNRELREGLRQLIAQCDETDWMGPAGKMDAALDPAKALLDAAREGGE